MRDKIYLTVLLFVLGFLIGGVVHKLNANSPKPLQHIDKSVAMEHPKAPPQVPPVPAVIPSPTSYTEAMSLSKRYNKKLFLVFSATWCGACKEMKQNVWPDKSVKEALSKYVVYFVDVDKERELANQYGIRSIPQYGIFDVSEGTAKPIKVTAGDMSVQDFLTWLNAA
jgi:thioredoxin-related protein